LISVKLRSKRRKMAERRLLHQKREAADRRLPRGVILNMAVINAQPIAKYQVPEITAHRAYGFIVSCTDV